MVRRTAFPLKERALSLATVVEANNGVPQQVCYWLLGKTTLSFTHRENEKQQEITEKVQHFNL